MFKIGENAVLMRLAISLPGEERQDPTLSRDVKKEHKLGEQSGKWIKKLYPPTALASLKKLDNEARQFHNSMTLPYDQGIGILPAKLIPTYSEKMRHFGGMRENLRDNEFLADPGKLIKWAMREHNGTFDPDLYPGLYRLKDAPEEVKASGEMIGLEYVLDVEGFREAMRSKFAFEVVPLPVPESGHFSKTVSSLLGVDAEAVDIRIKDAQVEAQREVIERLQTPVIHMASKLAGRPCPCRKCKGAKGKTDNFKDSLVDNLKEIAAIGEALNLADDPKVNAFVKEIEALSKVDPQILRDNKAAKADALSKADDLAKRLSGYKF